MLALLGLAVLISVPLAQSSSRRMLTKNPTLRAPATWSRADLGRLFHDPRLHWCGGNHGHGSGRGSSWDCKGRPDMVMAAIERNLQSHPWAEEELIALLWHQDPEAVVRAAEVLSRWRSRRAVAPLVARLQDLSQQDEPDVMSVRCIAWALGHIQDRSALPALRAASTRFPSDAASAIKAIEAGHPCDGRCSSPYRK